MYSRRVSIRALFALVASVLLLCSEAAAQSFRTIRDGSDRLTLPFADMVHRSPSLLAAYAAFWFVGRTATTPRGRRPLHPIYAAPEIGEASDEACSPRNPCWAVRGRKRSLRVDPGASGQKGRPGPRAAPIDSSGHRSGRSSWRQLRA